ncbi:hypothetical protein ACFOQM_14730 [Paenibacillus sp. GCM10012307]|uniref:Bacterio-opsin activator n=1 Tax=Paenibacillus roseus TaxID=2798579 RepID=A0A934J921_9BACL|nr:hypothetical protein [Paenibacillus roseus]MBJ6362518.1 hypothetical protein [Paenibacillus roseus]
MKYLSEALSVERARLFVGREEELSFMRNWVTREDAPTEVLFLSGMGGIGKSALMLQFLNMAQMEGIFYIWLDGRVCTDTPAGFIESLHSFLIHKPLAYASPNRTFQDIVAEMTRQKVLLCIDNYENIHRIEGWLKEVFLPGLSSTGLLVMLASRQDLSFHWQNDLAWQSRIRHIRLGPLTRSEAQHYFHQRGVGTETERLISDSQGLPLAMALFVEHLRLLATDTAAFALPVSMRVSAEMLREAISSNLKEVLDLLCVLPYANSQWLGRFLTTPLTGMDLQKLIQISFVRPTAGGLALHDVARTFLIEDFLQRDPERFQALRLKIMIELAKNFKEAVGQEKKRIASVMLSVCRDVFRLNSNFIFAINPDVLQMQPYQKSDLPHLHQIIAEESEYTVSAATAHALLDALSEQFPDCIQVIRSKDGIPQAFTSGVLLYKETISLLERFMPNILDLVFPKEIHQMRSLSIEEADTFYQLISGVSSRINDTSYYEMVGSFVGTVVLDMIASNSAGLCIVIVTAHEQIKELLRNLSLQSRPFPTRTKKHPLFGATIYENDFRGLDFGDHLLKLVKTPLGRGNTDKSSDHELSEKEIVDLLTRIGDPAALERTDVAHRLSCSGPELNQILQSVFSEQPPFPITMRNQAILQMISEAPLLSAEIAADRLHISRATYYRARNAAIGSLKKVLMRKGL